jgi:acyl-CoA thioesterase I
MRAVAPNADRRVFFVGDSYVAGVGDPEHRGWVGRLAEHAHRAGAPITAYNLGVRRDTSDDICRRWPDEVAVRRGAGAQERLVVSFGVNDTTSDGCGTRVAPERTVANLRTPLAEASAAGLPALVVGPPPVADRAQNRLIAALDERLAATAADARTP